MAFIINTLYAILTWLAAFTIGQDSWLGWALIAMAMLQTWALVMGAIKEL